MLRRLRKLSSFVCSEAGDNPGRHDKLMLQLPPAGL
jgi:hypothetical protein